jgi:2-succinyl-5-enolpyruvyl-6-hydroxy-3-cyclohexene-1-carboxylate synthase
VSAAVQTIWAELLVGTLADAGVTTCVVSPGSRSTPLVAALVADGRFALPTIIDERAAAFYALGVARATDATVAMICTSGSAAAHYLPAIVEASMAGVALVAITSDRPPELQHCGASQTIDQIDMYGGFVRAAFDIGAPVGSELALRALRRTVVQAIAAARGPRPGPVHVNVPLRKPLEPAAPQTDDERALAAIAAGLRGPLSVPATHISPDAALIATLAARIAAEPRGVIVAGAMPIGFARAREAAFELARRTGYPLLAESGSQLRFAARAGVACIDRIDLVLAAKSPAPALVIQLGAEPVAAAWPGAFANAERWVLADAEWLDPDSRAHVIVGDVAATLAALARTEPRADRAFASQWLAVEHRASAAVERAAAAHPRTEGDVLLAALAAMPPGALVQLGNSLPIRVVDQMCTGGERLVVTQRGAAGIDGLVASATGATAAGPVLLVLGDVSFAHDLGSLIVARHALAPLAIVVIDNDGGRIFGGLPIARSAHTSIFERHWLAAPAIDPVAIAAALGIRVVVVETPAATAAAVASALATPGPTVIHAPVSPTGARDLRTTALELLQGAP